MVIMGESRNLLNLANSTTKSVEDLLDVCTTLHGDDSQLIFFVNPHEECLVIVVEDTSVIWPVTIQIACFEETVAFSKTQQKIKFFSKIFQQDICCDFTYLKRK